jgi:DNA-binding HxlR family transcriptional regulator
MQALKEAYQATCEMQALRVIIFLMQHNSDRCRSNCPINFVLETFGDKWTLLIVRDLLFHGKRHYGEFLASDEQISTNILAERLQRLERDGVVEKQADPNHGSKVIYRLTQKGRDLLPIMLEITAWSGKYDSRTNAPKAFLKELAKDRPRLAKQILANLDETEKS